MPILTLAPAEELNRLLADRSHRQLEVTQHQEWRDALIDLKHRLQEFVRDYPRGWFRDQRQQSEILASELSETEQLVARLSNQQQTLLAEIEQARQQSAALSTSSSRLTRNRDRLEQFERAFGSQTSVWRQDLVDCRQRAEKARQQQADLRQKAAAWRREEQQFFDHVHAKASLIGQLQSDLAKIKYVDAAARVATPGRTEELRAQYELLLADYEGKVNADALSQWADNKDLEAQREDREFQRVLASLPHLTREEVEADLQLLPDGVTPQQQLEQADKALDVATGKLGPLARSLESIQADADLATKECQALALTGGLPKVDERLPVDEHLARTAQAHRDHDEHAQLAAEFRIEVEQISQRLTANTHEAEKLNKDQQRLTSIGTSHERQFQRWRDAAVETSQSLTTVPIISDSAALAKQIDALEKVLIDIRSQLEALDARRDTVGRDIMTWSRQEHFTKLRSSISHRFLDRDVATLEAKVEFDLRQLHDRVFQIQEKLKEADQQRDIVIHVLLTAVDEALGLLARVSRMSKLPDSLPHGGKQFLKIETKASDNPAERRTYIGELIDELLERGDVGDGLQLVQKAVRRVARRVNVRVLHPDLHQRFDRVTIAQMRGLSGGERLTSAILLYCALIRLRQSESQRPGGSSVLILDNPIGTASRLSFLEMQREVAHAMNVQLIYATAVHDLNAIGALENIIRLRNARADRRTGRRFIEADRNGDTASASIETARIVFDTPPSSLLRRQESESHDRQEEVDNEVQHDARND